MSAALNLQPPACHKYKQEEIKRQKHLIIRAAVHEMLSHQLAYGIAQTAGFWQLFEYFILEPEWFHDDPFYIYTLSISFIGFCGGLVFLKILTARCLQCRSVDTSIHDSGT